MTEAYTRNGVDVDAIRVKQDAADRQKLLLICHSVTLTDAYIANSVKIEPGAKSALDPNTRLNIAPYVDAERTLCDKVVILHGLRRWCAILGQLRGNGQRISRHYYDLYRLLQSEIGRAAMANLALGLDCVAHARIFFNRPDFALGSAHPPTFALGPESGMIGDLRKDYRAMSNMIFGEPLPFDAIIEDIAERG